MVAYELPQDILIDIFLRLPAKSIGKCRCLSKQWRTLLSTHQFIKSHFTSRPHQENLIVGHSDSVYSITSIKEDPCCRKLKLPYEICGVVGSCDGLVLLLTKESMLLVNPTTLFHVEIPKIPDPPLALDEDDTFSLHGLGYDSSNDDYKVVTLSCYIDYEVDAFYHAVVDVYSMKSGVWKRVGISPHDPYTLDPSCGAFLNGAIHWLAYYGVEYFSIVILAFNLVDEVFDIFHTPSSISMSEFRFNQLGLLGGCLCIIDTSSSDVQCNDRTDVWVMQEYGLEESWSKFGIGGNHQDLQSLCFSGAEEFVMLQGRNLVVYNKKEGTLMDMVIDGAPTKIADGRSFAESLFSPALNGI